MTVAVILGVIILICLVSLLGGFVFMLLWNWILPFLFGVPKIGLWMSIGIMLLLSIIGSFFRNGKSDKYEKLSQRDIERYIRRTKEE